MQLEHVERASGCLAACGLNYVALRCVNWCQDISRNRCSISWEPHANLDSTDLFALKCGDDGLHPFVPSGAAAHPIPNDPWLEMAIILNDHTVLSLQLCLIRYLPHPWPDTVHLGRWFHQQHRVPLHLSSSHAPHLFLSPLRL